MPTLPHHTTDQGLGDFLNDAAFRMCEKVFVRQACFSQTGQGFWYGVPTLPTVRILENCMAKSRSQNRVLDGAIRTLFGHLKAGVHDPLPCETHLYKRLTFGLESHQASLGQTV